MTETVNGLTEEQLAIIGTQFKPDIGPTAWYRIGATTLSIVVAGAIWFLKVAPDDKSPSRLMVEPADELLSSFVQPAVDVPGLSRDLGLKVVAPDLKPLGAELTTVGATEFAGRPAGVVEYKLGFTDYLLYSFNNDSKLLAQMRKVDCSDCRFFITSAGAVSVVVWQDKALVYHALAAKVTEQDLLSLAKNVARMS